MLIVSICNKTFECKFLKPRSSSAALDVEYGRLVDRFVPWRILVGTFSEWNKCDSYYFLVTTTEELKNEHRYFKAVRCVDWKDLGVTAATIMSLNLYA
jgi:hypothetical protein